MTVCTYNRRETTLTVSGHAGFDIRGKDTVCACASILTFAAAETIQDSAAKYFPAISIEDGKVRIACNPRGGNIHPCRRVLDTIFMGFEILENQFPNYVRTEREE